MIGADIKVGFCQRCGRAVKLKNSDGRTQAEWDAKATEKCRCPKRPKKRKAVNDSFGRYETASRKA